MSCMNIIINVFIVNKNQASKSYYYYYYNYIDVTQLLQFCIHYINYVLKYDIVIASAIIIAF